MPLRSVSAPRQEFLVNGNLAVGTHTFGPFYMADQSHIIIDVTRSDDGASGTATMVMQEPINGTLVSVLDGAGNAVAMNDWAAGENVRRQLIMGPTAGPIASSDADGVGSVGTTGAAQVWYRQQVPPEFWLSVVIGTDTSTFNGVINFTNA